MSQGAIVNPENDNSRFCSKLMRVLADFSRGYAIKGENIPSDLGEVVNDNGASLFCKLIPDVKFGWRIPAVVPFLVLPDGDRE